MINLGTKRSTLLRGLGTAVSLGLLVYLLSQQGWQEILDAVRQIPAWKLALVFGLMLVSRLAVTLRWYTLLRGANAGFRFSQVLRVTFAGLFASNFLPTTIGGDVVRLAGAIQLRLDAATSAASLIADRLVGMAGMAMAAPFGLPVFLASDILRPQPASVDPTLMIALLPASLASKGKALWERLARLFQRLLATLSIWLKKPVWLLIALGFSWVHMLCLFSFFAILFRAMDQPISFVLIGGLYSLVYFITLLPISINGYGVQEISMTFVFTHLGGVSLGSALTVAILFRTFMMAASLPGAAFVPELVAGRRKASQPGTVPAPRS